MLTRAQRRVACGALDALAALSALALAPRGDLSALRPFVEAVAAGLAMQDEARVARLVLADLADAVPAPDFTRFATS